MKETVDFILLVHHSQYFLGDAKLTIRDSYLPQTGKCWNLS